MEELLSVRLSGNMVEGKINQDIELTASVLAQLIQENEVMFDLVISAFMAAVAGTGAWDEIFKNMATLVNAYMEQMEGSDADNEDIVDTFIATFFSEKASRTRVKKMLEVPVRPGCMKS